ncbi:hypothetical protein CFOL_v3_31319, partial [Cephalotus follicularis]
IFILCISMHACKARHYGVLNKGSTTPNYFTSKGLEKAELNLDSIQGPNEDANYSIGAVPQELNDSKALLKEQKQNRRETSGLAPIKPPVSVSWRVPRKENKDNPVFYSDYSQPDTSTPSHN